MKLPTILVVAVVAVRIGLASLINEAISEPLSDHLNQISMKSFKVALQNEPDNFIFSPVSISHLLSMISRGAVGETRSEFETYLPEGRYEMLDYYIYELSVFLQKWNKNTLNIENKIYLNEKIKAMPQCKKFFSAIYPFRVEQLNFDNIQNSQNTINNWIQSNNNYCLEHVETDDVANINGLLLMSIIKFTAGWKNGFRGKNIISGFYLDNTDSINVPFLTGIRTVFMSKNSDLNATIVKLPYQMPHKQPPVSMFIIVPNERYGLKHVENNIDKINITTLQDLKSNLVKLSIPVFKLETKIDIKEHLKKMGMKKSFARDAEFSDNCPVDISKIIQKASISIDAEGTGATAALYNDEYESELSNSEDIKLVKANHPFLVVMVAEDLILFTGRVTIPEKNVEKLCHSDKCLLNL